MREAARALDDVSDHLGEVLRRADDLLTEWGRFGAQVRAQVEREAAAIGEVVDGAVGRAAAAGIDRAIGDRLRALTAELERIEQRARAASRAVVEQRAADRRILWAVVAGIVLANALLVVLILRKPDAAPVAEPIRLDAPAQPAAPAPAPSAMPEPAGAPAGSGAASAGATLPEPAAGSPAGASAAAPPAAGSGATAGSAASTGPGAAARPAAAGPGAPGSGVRPAEAGPKAPVAPPVRPGAPHPHKKLP
jgi:hypothetical protein